MKQMEKIPEYAKGSVYQEMVFLCEQTGRHIEYMDAIEEGAYAQTDTLRIRMPLQNNFSSDKHAALTLGHELAHGLIESWYLSDERPISDGVLEDDLSLHVVIEADCDRIGAALYELAEEIAVEKAKNAFVAAAAASSMSGGIGEAKK